MKQGFPIFANPKLQHP